MDPRRAYFMTSPLVAILDWLMMTSQLFLNFSGKMSLTVKNDRRYQSEQWDIVPENNGKG